MAKARCGLHVSTAEGAMAPQVYKDRESPRCRNGTGTQGRLRQVVLGGQRWDKRGPADGLVCHLH